MAPLFTHKVIFSCLVLFLYFYKGTVSTKQPKSDIQRLRNDLLKDYDKNSRPVMDSSNTTTVKFSLTPIYLDDLDEEKQILRMESWVHLSWKDHHLTWNPDHYGEIDVTHFAMSEIWLPDIYIYSSIPLTGIHPTLYANVLCFPDGTVLWIPPVTINLYCKLDYTDYPNDVQICMAKFQSWTHEGFAIDLVSGLTIRLDNFHNTNPHWELLDVQMERSVMHFLDKSNSTGNAYRIKYMLEPSIDMKVTFYLRRRNSFTPRKMIGGPSLVAVLLTLTMFWLPCFLVQKLILGCISLVILIVLLLYIGEAGSSSVPMIISAYSIHSLMYTITTAIIMETVLINLGRIVGPRRPPALSMQILSGKLARVLLIFAPPKNSRLVDKTELNNQEEVEQTGLETIEKEWLCVSTALDRTCFFIYLLVFVVERSLSRA